MVRARDSHRTFASKGGGGNCKLNTYLLPLKSHQKATGSLGRPERMCKSGLELREKMSISSMEDDWKGSSKEERRRMKQRKKDHTKIRCHNVATSSTGSIRRLLVSLVGVLLIAKLAPLGSYCFNTNPSAQTIEGCKFYPVGENRRFERVAENLPVGSEIFKLEAHPRGDFKIEPVDNSLSDVNYFKYVVIDDRFVAIKLNQSLEDLVDRENSFLPVTVYISDVNDHAPEFQNVPYNLEVDELTPVGLTIFRSIHAIDRDKPNTANSDITYSIVGGNDNDSFILSDPIEGILVMNKPLDYDNDKREYKIQIQASDHGTPTLSSVTTMTVRVKDADDQNPVFSHEVYTASVSESAQIMGKRIRDKVRVDPPIQAFDQDTGINARLRYSIILGNEAGFFEMNAQTGELFLIREIDLEKLANPTLSLQIQASQVDNPFRQALARVDIAVQDINDNSPEFEYDMYNITVIENLPPGFTVLQVFATDSDQGENGQFKYLLHDESGAFKIDPSSGWISVKDPTKLDRETTDKIRMQVTTVERKPNINPDIGKRKRGTSVEINLLDSNDNTPFFVGAAQRTLGKPDGSDLEQFQQSSNCLNVTRSDSSSGDCIVPTNLYNFNVLETAAPGTLIGHVYAYDRDLSDNGRVQYFKQNDSISLSAPFDVNPINGSVFVLPQFTRLAKKLSSYTLFVKAVDSAPILFERRHSVAVVQINVTDINNSVPEFIGTTPFEAYVGESLPEGAFVTQIYAKDDDSVNEQLGYSIVAGNDEKLFIIDSRSGKMYTSAVLDFEKKQSYDLLVQVSDGINTAVAPLIINIIDINDQQPVFTHQFYNFTVMEESGANQTVGQLQAQDRDSGKNSLLTYALVGEQANNAFVLDPKTGHLRTRRSLDCDVEPTIDFVVVARDSGIPQLSGSANVRVRVEDLNDWAPKFEQARYEVEVQEEVEAPVDVLQVKAHDRDRDENSIIKYRIIGGNDQSLFNINDDTGLISTASKLNYEAKTEHRLQVAALNVRSFQGPLARNIVNPTVEVVIKVVDRNDETVTFEKPANYHWKMSELTAKDTVIGRVNASNHLRKASEQEIVYWLGPVQVLHPSNQQHQQKKRLNDTSFPATGGRLTNLSQKLKINEQTGEIFLVDQIDRDAPSNEHAFRFTVFARDTKSINKLNASAPVIIDVIDANDNPPTFDESVYHLEMPENLPAGTTIPSFFSLEDADSGQNGRIVSYYINGTQQELEIFHMNNATGVITLRNPLDYERQSVHKFEIVAVDGGQQGSALQGTAQVIVQVANINEFSPKFTNLPYEYVLQENALPGTQVGQVKAIDQDGNKIVYSINDGDTDFFSIEPLTGKIYVSRQLLPRTQYNFVVRATDDGQPQNYSLGVQVLIKIRDTNDFPPIFTSNLYIGSVVEKQARSGGPNGGPNLVRVEAMDKDLQNNTLSYSIISGNEEGIFTIDRRTGEVRVAPNQAHRLDYDRRRQYTLLVQAQDSHEAPLQGLTMVQLDVLDVNDHPPTFSKAAYVAQVAENAPAGTCFFRIEADARDSTDTLFYSLSWANAGHQQPAAASSAIRAAGKPATGDRSNDKSPMVDLFEVHPTKGLLCTRAPLDREQRVSYELTVTVSDGRYESHSPISVEILDENDNKPVFDLDQYQVSIPYDSQPGRPVISVRATDADAGSNGNVQYWIKNTHGLFQIDAKTGQVRLVSRLPMPNMGSNQSTAFELRLFAQDQGSSPQIGEASLLIRLTNNENHPPKFDKFVYQTSVDENVNGLQLIQVQASDPDPGKAGKIVYRLARVQSTSLARAPVNKKHKPSSDVGQDSESAESIASSSQEQLRSSFRVDKSTGKVTLVEPLDYEETHNVELSIEARDEALVDAQSTTTLVQVQVNDVNDHKPEFFAMPRVLRISSTTQPLTENIYTLQAIDADSSANDNNQIEYRLEQPSSYFSVHPVTGALFASKQLPNSASEASRPDLELENSGQTGSPTVYTETLTVIARDKAKAQHQLMDKVTFELQVYKDQADDAHPMFTSNQYFIQSDKPIEPGTVILTPKATVPNGEPLLYNITAVDSGKQSSRAGSRSLVKRFAIDPETGRISTTGRLEPNELTSRNIFHFTVKATNRNQPELSSEAGVVVRLLDSNIRCPRFPFTEYYASVPENARVDSTAVADLVIDEVERFAGQKLSYQITEDNSNDNFFIDVSAGSSSTTTSPSKRIQVSLRVKKALDRESMPKFLAGVYTLTVSATNARCATQARVKIMVEDQNDNSPQFEKQEYVVDLRENSPIGQVITQLQATDLDELDNHKLRYFISDGHPDRDAFEMEQKSGTISVRREIDREKAASYLLKIMALDQANNTGWTNVRVNVLDENDWTPTFLNETFIMNATEGPTSVGTRVRLPVFDYDDGMNRQMEVYIVDGNAGNEFRLDVDEGGPLLTIVQELDWEKFAQLRPKEAHAKLADPATAVHAVQVAAKDKGSPARIGKTTVLVFISDINDNPPKFVHESYYEFLDEAAAPGSLVTTIQATDSDSTLNTNLTYSLVGRKPTTAVANGQRQPPPPLPFTLNPYTGALTVARQLDISEQQQYVLTVEAFDGLWRSETQLRIYINEVEDPPADVSARTSDAANRYRFHVLENLPNALVGVVDLKPRRIRVNSQLRYSIVNSEMRSLFHISQLGEIFTARGLDREQKAQYTFTVMLEERRASSKLTVAEVIVDILDENDEIPSFTNVYQGSIRENSPPGTTVFLAPSAFVKAIDGDTGNNSIIRYSLQGPGSDKFAVLPSGAILFKPQVGSESQPLDRELKSDYKLDIWATDSGNLSSKTALTIKIDDENDNAPVFETGPLFVLIPETAKAGSRIVQVKARDRDEPGPNSELHYRISSASFQAPGSHSTAPANNLNDVIRIDQLTGELFVVGRLQPASTYHLNISASDSGGLSAYTHLNVTVVDVNDHRPEFERSSYSFVLLEGNYSQNALRLGTIRATDADIGRNSQIEYLLITDAQYEASLPIASPATQLASLLSREKPDSMSQSQQQVFPLSIDVHTGELFARAPVDREQRDSYQFKVLAIDMGEPSMNSTCDVTVKVKDINDEPPRFYTDPYLALVPENLEPGHKVTQIAAFDPDSGENGQVFYKLGEGHEGKFYIDGKDGTVWTLAPLDYEQKNFYNITIIAYDRGSPSLSSSAKLWITVADMNDAVPNFAKAVYTLEVAENAKLGDTVFVLNAGKGAFKYCWLHPTTNEAGNRRRSSDDGTDTFTIEPNSGHIKLAKPLDSLQRNHYRLMVKAQDESEPPKWDSAEVNILVGTGRGVRLFAQRVHEVSVLENQLAPMMILDLNSTDEMIHQPVQYSIVGSDYKGLFRIEPDTGRLSVTSSLDRERRDSYTIKVRAETSSLNVRQKRHASGNVPVLQTNLHRLNRWSASMLTSSTTRAPGLNRRFSELSESDSSINNHLTSSSSHIAALQNLHLAYDETFVSVVVEDENDNSPSFLNRGKPIVAAVPLEASFGYEVAKVKAQDADVGLNSQLRYEIQTRHDDASTKFYIDPVTGVVRSMVNFAMNSGQMYNFDVKATDRDGHESGNSASIQMFVYVLPETKMVLLVTDTEPIVMEKRANEVLGYLTNATGFDVKLAKLEPHIEGESPEPFSTDMFLYAVNPTLNNIVDTETLLNVLRQSSQVILSHLHGFKVRRIQGVTVQEKISQMGATEIAIIALSSVVFLGSIMAIILLCSCSNSNKKDKSSQSSRQAIWDQQRVFGLKNPLMGSLQTSTDHQKLGSGSQRSSSEVSNAPTTAPLHRGSSNINNNITNIANGKHQPMNSTYSGDGANSSEYVDSLISYKRSSGDGSQQTKQQIHQSSGVDLQSSDVSPANSRLTARDGPTGGRGGGTQKWGPESDITAMNEHHLHHTSLHQHHHHYHQRLHQQRPSDSMPDDSEEAAAHHPIRIVSGSEGISNTEVHSDNEVFEEEEEEFDDEHAIARLSHRDQLRASVRSADRSIYSGHSSWDTGDEEEHHGRDQKYLPHSHHHHHRHHQHLHHHHLQHPNVAAGGTHLKKNQDNE